MTLDEMELQNQTTTKTDPPEGGGTTMKVTHVAIIEDEESGQVGRLPLTFHLGCNHHDAHLGAVCD